MCRKKLEQKIEDTREQLIYTATRKGLQAEETLLMSRLLDKYINLYLKNSKENGQN